jgi:hypothetical protein
MRSVQVTVRDGKLVVDGVELPNGTSLTLLIADDCDIDDSLVDVFYAEEEGDVVVAERTLERCLRERTR